MPAPPFIFDEIIAECRCYLQVAVDGIWKLCPQAGGPIQFPGFNGKEK